MRRGDGQAYRSEGEPALADEGEPVGDVFEVGQVAADEADVADPCGCVEGCGGQRELQPVVGQRPVEAGQCDPRVVEAPTLAEHPRLEPADRLGVGRFEERSERAEGRIGVAALGLDDGEDAGRAGVGGVAPHEVESGPQGGCVAPSPFEVAIEERQPGLCELQVGPARRRTHRVGQHAGGMHAAARQFALAELQRRRHTGEVSEWPQARGKRLVKVEGDEGVADRRPHLDPGRARDRPEPVEQDACRQDGVRPAARP